MASLRRSFKRRLRPAPPATDFQEGLIRHEISTRRRESLRLRKSGSDRNREEELARDLQAEERLSLGTVRLLSAAGDTLQRLQAAKALLLSGLRQDALRAQLSLVRQLARVPGQNRKVDSISGRLGEASLSDIRVPLRWSPEAVLSGVGDRRQFAIFGVVSCEAQVYDTVLAYPVDCQTTDLIFSDVILVCNIRPAFKLRLDLYSYCLPTLSRRTAPKSLLHALRARLLRKAAAADELDLGQECPEFLHIASAVLTINDAGSGARCHQLLVTQQAAGNKHRVPLLFDQFSYRLAVRPTSANEPQEMAGRMSLAWPGSDIVLADCDTRLADWQLQLWTTPARLRRDSRPCHIFTLTGASRLESSAEQLSFSLADEEGVQAVFKCSSLGELTAWVAAIEELIADLQQWQQQQRDAAGPMEILSPGAGLPPATRRSRVQKTKSMLLLMYNRISAVNIAQI